MVDATKASDSDQDQQRLIKRRVGLCIFLGFILVSVYVVSARGITGKLCEPQALWALADHSPICLWFGIMVTIAAVLVVFLRVNSGLTRRENNLPAHELNQDVLLGACLFLLVIASCILWACSAGSFVCVKANGIEFHSRMFAEVSKKTWSDVQAVHADCGLIRGGIPWSALTIFIRGYNGSVFIGINYTDPTEMAAKLTMLADALKPFSVNYVSVPAIHTDMCPPPFIQAIKSLPF